MCRAAERPTTNPDHADMRAFLAHRWFLLARGWDRAGVLRPDWVRLALGWFAPPWRVALSLFLVAWAWRAAASGWPCFGQSRPLVGLAVSFGALPALALASGGLLAPTCAWDCS